MLHSLSQPYSADTGEDKQQVFLHPPFFFKYSDAVLHSNPILSPTMSLSTFASIQGYSGVVRWHFDAVPLVLYV